MSGGGMRWKRCAFPSMALLPECFSPFSGESVLAASGVAWAGCAGQGDSPFEASAQGVRFHDGFSWFACFFFFFFFFFFFALLTGGPSPSYNGRDCPVWGSTFLLRRMNGCREVPCPGHEADSPWHPQERHGIHVCPAAKTVSPRLRRIPENGFSATLRTSCSFSEIVPKEICFF